MPKETVTDARPGKCVYFKGCLLGIGEIMGKKLKWINGDDFMGANNIEVDTCDYHGKCKRRAYVEVFPGGSWSYLCFFHFTLERLRFRKWKYGWCKVND